jgi:transposase
MNTKNLNTSEVRGEQAANTLFEIIHLGLDLHKKSVVVTRIIDGATPEKARRLTWGQLWKFVADQLTKADQVCAVYEAGAFGFSPCRKLQAMGARCLVIHPEKLDPRCRRVQNDNSDSQHLAMKLQRYVGGNNKAMTVVYVPTVQEEARRRPARHRDQIHKTVESLKARGRGLLLSEGIFDYTGWYRQAKWDQLQGRLNSALAAVLEDLRQSIEHFQKQLRAVEKQLEAAAPAQLPKGFGKLTFELLLRLLCNYDRFNSRRRVAGFTGLCGGVSASGDYHMDLSINKAGEARLRSLLVELAWRMIYWQPRYKGLKTWKKLGGAGVAKRRRKIALIAVARQLIVDIWKWQTGRCTPEQLGWEMTAAQ